ncbi:MAG TPA: hypothetical protein DIU39_00220 [Flavobacteriales bacterium]|nr:hypothetical protein [Flavobacteriales bacterium]
MNSLRKIALNLTDKNARKVSRTIRVHNMQTAKNIGIAYNATVRSDEDKVVKLIRFFKEERKNVTALGFINSKKPEDMPEQKLNHRYFNKKSLNWLGLPKKSDETLKSFVNQSFDILINLDLEGENLPLLWIFALSKAQFKVSAAHPLLEKYADFMLDVSSKNDISYFNIQLKHYLKIINKKSEEYEHV